MSTDTRNLINKWLQIVASDAQIPSLALDANGVCALRYGEDIECVIECPEGSEVIYFYTPMCNVPDMGAERLFREVLKANLFCSETHGATFAIDEVRNRLILCYPQPTALLDEQLFANILANFLEISAIWYERLNSRAPRTEGSAAELARLKDEKLWTLNDFESRI